LSFSYTSKTIISTNFVGVLKIKTMLSQIIIFISLLLTGLGAGLFFYMLVGGNPAYKAVSGKTFVEYHKKLDRYMTIRMPPFFLTGVMFIIAWLYIEQGNWQSFRFLMVVLALLFSIIEVIVMFKGNRPINFLIQTLSPDTVPDDWYILRDKWVYFMYIRITTGILTFVCLLLAVVFGQ
jgi:hypothetical protein